MLLKVIKNPISRHLPAGARCYGKLSLLGLIDLMMKHLLTTQHNTLHHSMFVIAIQGFSHLGSLHSPIHFASNLPDRTPLVLIFGAQASRGIVAADHPYVSRQHPVGNVEPAFIHVLLLLLMLNG